MSQYNQPPVHALLENLITQLGQQQFQANQQPQAQGVQDRAWAGYNGPHIWGGKVKKPKDEEPEFRHGFEVSARGKGGETIPIDVYEDASVLTAKLAVPGVDSVDRINVDFDAMMRRKITITVQGVTDENHGELLHDELPKVNSTRSIELSESYPALDDENFSAFLKSGVLTISLPKVRPDKPPKRRIPIRLPGDEKKKAPKEQPKGRPGNGKTKDFQHQVIEDEDEDGESVLIHTHKYEEVERRL